MVYDNKAICSSPVSVNFLILSKDTRTRGSAFGIMWMASGHEQCFILKRPLCRSSRSSVLSLSRVLVCSQFKSSESHVLRSSCLRADAEQVNASDSLGRTALMYAVHQLALASSASASASSGTRGSVLRELLARPQLEVNAASNGALHPHMYSNSTASSPLFDASLVARAVLYTSTRIT